MHSSQLRRSSSPRRAADNSPRCSGIACSDTASLRASPGGFVNALQRLRRHGRSAVIGLACTALVVAISAGLVQRSESSATESGQSRQPVAVSLEPYPEGPVFTISRGGRQWSDLSLPAALPKPIPQRCEPGLEVVVTLADGSRSAYGPCRRPAVIRHLLADLLSVAHGQDLLVSVAPRCAKKLLLDWFDNARIDRLYRHVCYAKALDLLPEGFEDLGGAEATIRRAFTALYGPKSPAQVTSSGHAAGGLPSSLAGLCLPNADAPPCGSGVRMGVDYEHLLYTHCGVESTIFDGRLWLAQPPLDEGGVRGAPQGWSDPTQGGVMYLLGDNRAEFRADALVASFAPAPPSYARKACD